MTLNEWREKEAVTYRWIMKRLGPKWGRVWLSMIFNDKGKPGTDLLMALKKLTGLSDDEILGRKND